MNILLTSVGRRSYLVNYFKEAINGKGEIHVANSSDISPAFQVADKSVVTPLIYDDNYIPFLLQYCKNNKIDILLSLFDIDLPILSKNSDKFDNIGVQLIVSDYKFIEICNDKWETFLFLKKHGLNTPKTFICIDDVENALNNNEVSFPLILKPRWGMGSIGIFEADNNEELKVLYNKTLNKIKKSYLKYESIEDINNSVLIQEKIDGEEFGLDIINDLDSNYINTVVKKKYAMRSGETDCAITVNNTEIKKLGEKISSFSKHIANLDVDVFVTKEKTYILEMNARFGGGYPFSYMAGVNLPLAIIEWTKGKTVDKEILTEKENIISHKDISIVELNKNIEVK